MCADVRVALPNKFQHTDDDDDVMMTMMMVMMMMFFAVNF